MSGYPPADQPDPGSTAQVLAVLFDVSDHAQLVTDGQGVIELANRSAAALFGHAPRQLIGMDVSMLVPLQSREAHRDHVGWFSEQSAEDQVRPNRLVHALHADGTEFAVSVDLSPLDTPLGPRTHAGIVAIDRWAETVGAGSIAFEASPIPMCLTELEGGPERIIRSPNQALCDFLGYARDELEGRSFRALTLPEDAPIDDAAAERFLAGTERDLVRRKRYLHHDGHHVWGELHAQLLPHSPSGRITLVHIIDIGDTVRLEEVGQQRTDRLEVAVAERTSELADAQSRLRISLAAAAVSDWSYDLDRDRLEVDTFAVPSPVGADATTSAQVLQEMAPDDAATLRSAVKSSIEDRLPFDVTVRTADTPTRWMRVSGDVTRDDSGAALKIVGVTQDVTAEHLSHELMAARGARLRLVLEATTTGTWEWDIERDTIAFSDTWLASLGYSADEIGGGAWHWDCVIHPDDWPEAQRRLDEHLAGHDEFCEYTARMRRRDGTWRWSRTRGKVVERAADGRPLRMIGAETDISDQRVLEDQLVHAAKMQALGALSGGIAHDFNNVLAIVTGHVELIAHAGGVSPATSARLQGVQRAVDRAAQLVKRLMLLGRPATDNPILIDVTEFIDGLAQTLRQLLPEHITLEFELPAVPAFVRIDQSRLEAAMLNLVTNARDAIPDGGTLLVRAEHLTDTNRALVRLEVTDNGMGMDQATREAIFDPFFTTKGPGVGTGLGLATTYSSIIGAGGTIEALSMIGRGTTIRIELPAATGTSTDAASAAATQRSLRSEVAGSTILVVEDEAELLELTADILRSHGHRVFEALGGQEAIDILADTDTIDLLLTDVVMPSMSGTELAARACALRPSLEVLFLSGYAEPAGGAIDPSRLLSKPIGERDLTAAVEAVLAKDPRPG